MHKNVHKAREGTCKHAESVANAVNHMHFNACKEVASMKASMMLHQTSEECFEIQGVVSWSTV